MQDGNL